MNAGFVPVLSTPAPVFERYVPANDFVAFETFETSFHGMRKASLKGKYGWGSGLPKLPREGCDPNRAAQADALRSLGLPKKADRLEMCGRLGELFECECGRVWKRGWGCFLRSCPVCGRRIFNRAFGELLPLEKHIPPALASLSGWGWKVLDFTFHHDGDFPTREEMRKMREVVNRATDRAVREKCAEMYRMGKGCRLRLDNGEPMYFEGWPVASAPDGSARVLQGWVAVRVGRIEKRPTCVHCGSRVKKVKGERTRLCPKCGPCEWPDWENQETDNRRWRLRFGVLHIPVSEFGFNNANYHFHTCFFGPYLPNDPKRSADGAVVEDGRLTQIFRQESKKTLGVESRGVWIETAKRGYRSALAHALKYTDKMPGSTPQRLAEYEKVLAGVRRYAVRGFLQGVVLDEQQRGQPDCPKCKKPLKRVSGLGLVPLSEVQDIPFLPEEDNSDRVAVAYRNDDEFCFLEPEEMAAHAPRPPC